MSVENIKKKNRIKVFKSPKKKIIFIKIWLKSKFFYLKRKYPQRKNGLQLELQTRLNM